MAAGRKIWRRRTACDGGQCTTAADERASECPKLTHLQLHLQDAPSNRFPTAFPYVLTVGKESACG